MSIFFSAMAPATVPEIQRTNLMSVALQLKTYGINDLVHFHFMDAPPRQALIDAITDLYVLGALDRNGKVTALGQKVGLSGSVLDKMYCRWLDFRWTRRFRSCSSRRRTSAARRRSLLLFRFFLPSTTMCSFGQGYGLDASFNNFYMLEASP